MLNFYFLVIITFIINLVNNQIKFCKGIKDFYMILFSLEIFSFLNEKKNYLNFFLVFIFFTVMNQTKILFKFQKKNTQK